MSPISSITDYNFPGQSQDSLHNAAERRTQAEFNDEFQNIINHTYLEQVSETVVQGGNLEQARQDVNQHATPLVIVGGKPLVDTLKETVSAQSNGENGLTNEEVKQKEINALTMLFNLSDRIATLRVEHDIVNQG